MGLREEIEANNKDMKSPNTNSHSKYQVYDDKAASYHIPWYAVNDAVAMRMWSQAAADENSPFHINAADYTLFHVGYWDQITGDSQNLPNNIKRNLGTALQARRPWPIQGGETLQDFPPEVQKAALDQQFNNKIAQQLREGVKTDDV